MINNNYFADLPNTVMLFVLTILWTNSFSQMHQCEDLMFEKESTSLTTKSRFRLDRICESAISYPNCQINITVWQRDSTKQMPDFGLTESRMRNFFGILIRKNCSYLLGEISIVSCNDSSNAENPDSNIRMCIEELFPEVEKSNVYSNYDRKDTIIRGKSGTMIRFPARLFESSKLTDFDYVIDEITTHEAIKNNNMSTMTADGGLITNFRSLKVWVISKNSGISQMQILPAPITILVPVDWFTGITDESEIQLFKPAQKTRSYITWNNAEIYPSVEMYGGKQYYCFETNTLGYQALGCFVKSKKPLVLKIPKFYKTKVVVASHSADFIEIHEKRNQEKVRLFSEESCFGKTDDREISIEGLTRSGKLYVLKENNLSKYANKMGSQSRVIRKRDFVKL